MVLTLLYKSLFPFENCPRDVLRLALCTLPLFCLVSCKRISPAAPPHIQLDSTLVIPLSNLSVPVIYPVRDLEDMANQQLKGRIFDAPIQATARGDSLYLSISRFRPVRIKYNGEGTITYTLPLQINGSFSSKVLGVRIRNRTPVHARVILTMASRLVVSSGWEVKTRTELIGIEWIEMPRLNVAGLKLNLKKLIENAVEKNENRLTARLDGIITEHVQIRPFVSRLWTDIQKPVRVNRKLVPVWIKGNAVNIDASLAPGPRDTVVARVVLAASMKTVLDSGASIVRASPLPPNQTMTDVPDGLNMYVGVTVPFDKLNEFLNKVTDTLVLKFGNRKVRIKGTEVYGTREGLAVKLKIAGDVRGDIYLRGSIAFDPIQQKVFIDDFRFDVDSEARLVQLADWFTHEELLRQIRPFLSFEVGHAFNAVPALIENGIERGRHGTNLDLRVAALKISVHQYLITAKDIQIVFWASGSADILIEKEMFKVMSRGR